MHFDKSFGPHRPQLSEYEKKRLAKKKENAAMLAALGLTSALEDETECQQAAEQDLDADDDLFADLSDNEIYGQSEDAPSAIGSEGIGALSQPVMEEILQKSFGHETFRAQQEWIVRRCLSGESTLVCACMLPSINTCAQISDSSF